MDISGGRRSCLERGRGRFQGSMSDLRVRGQNKDSVHSKHHKASFSASFGLHDKKSPPPSHPTATWAGNMFMLSGLPPSRDGTKSQTEPIKISCKPNRQTLLLEFQGIVETPCA